MYILRVIIILFSSKLLLKPRPYCTDSVYINLAQFHLHIKIDMQTCLAK